MMFVVLAYDVGERRVGKVSKVAKKYLIPVQRSLYQGFLTEAQCERMKKELAQVIEIEKDSIVIYKLSNTEAVCFDEIGIAKVRESAIL